MEKDFSKIYVSLYNGVTDNRGQMVTMADFLSLDCRRTIERIRAATDPAERRRLKRDLPGATLSGVFAPTRAEKNLLAHTGYICIDIDAKDNPDRYLREIPPTLTQWDVIRYMARSASGNGIFALVPVSRPDFHRFHFNALVREFGLRGFAVDRACSDVSRMRYASFDPEPFSNPDARVFTEMAPEMWPYPECHHAKPKPPQRRNPYSLRHLSPFPPSGPDPIAREIEEFRRSGRTALDSYDDWLKAAYALASMGEDGRPLFHSAASLSPKYRREESDRLFNHALRTTRGEVSVGTLYWLLNNN